MYFTVPSFSDGTHEQARSIFSKSHILPVPSFYDGTGRELVHTGNEKIVGMLTDVPEGVWDLWLLPNPEPAVAFELKNKRT